MQFNRNAILVFSVTASVIAYLTFNSSTKQQQRQLQHNDVLERVFALHASSTAMEEDGANNNDGASNIAQGSSGDDSTSRNLFNIIGAMGGDLEVDNNEGPWAHYETYMTMYSSTPLNGGRLYTGDDTEFIHYKDPKEQDEDGTTTFPPTRKPIQQNTGDGSATAKPTSVPTKFPTSLPVTLEPTAEGETRRPTREPTRFPTKLPTREPTRFPTKEVRFCFL